jgi:hypothetical protein
MGNYRGRIVNMEKPPVGSIWRVTLDSGQRVYMHEIDVQAIENRWGGMPPEQLFFTTGRLDRVEWWGSDSDLRSAARVGAVDSRGRPTNQAAWTGAAAAYLNALQGLPSEKWINLGRQFAAGVTSSEALDRFDAAVGRAIAGLDQETSARLERFLNQIVRIWESALPIGADGGTSYQNLRNAAQYAVLGGGQVVFLKTDLDGEAARLEAAFTGLIDLPQLVAGGGGTGEPQERETFG